MESTLHREHRHSSRKELIDLIIKGYQSELEKIETGWPFRVDAAYRIIKDNFYRSHLDTAWILEQCATRSRSFYGQFKAHTGQSIWQLVLSHRIEVSKRMLKHRSLTVDEIAIGVGYLNSISFHRAFKKMVGMTPGAYREADSQYAD